MEQLARLRNHLTLLVIECLSVTRTLEQTHINQNICISNIRNRIKLCMSKMQYKILIVAWLPYIIKDLRELLNYRSILHSVDICLIILKKELIQVWESLVGKNVIMDF